MPDKAGQNKSPVNAPQMVENGGASQTPMFEYVCHPAARNLSITILTTLFLLLCVALVWLISHSIFMTALAVLILFGSLAGFYTRTRYVFYDDYFIITTLIHTQRKEWKLYRSYYGDRNGVLLSPFARPTRMENFRGVYIKFAGNKDTVMAMVRSKLEFSEDA